MKLLIVNGNTTAAITDRIAAAARAAAAPTTEIVAVSARFGARVVGTRAENAIAGHAVLEAAAENHLGCDAVLVAISTDSGVSAARELLPIPVIGITEAALLTACALGGRFGYLTFGQRAAALSRELVEFYGLSGRMAGLDALDAPAAAFAEPDGFAGPMLDGIARLVELGADSVVLAGAAFAGQCQALQAQAAVPLLDGVQCGVAWLEALVRLGLPKSSGGSYATPPARTLSGVGAALTALFRPDDSA